ncbi:MAG: ABC transporter substrate binding protein [Desulfobacterales bacterium]
MKTGMKVFAAAVLCVFLFHVAVFAADRGNFSTAPKSNEGKKWRIGYYEGGDYIDYQTNIIAIADGLTALKWIEKTQIPKQEGSQTKELWKWLAANVKSDCIEFVADGHYSANWDKELRVQMSEEIINRLNTKKDIDLIIAAGTWAGQDLSQGLAAGRYKTPTMVISTSDPIGAKIIKSPEDSGSEYLHARVAPLRHARQIQLFHEITGFKTLGVAHENSETGRSYAAMDVLEKAARERGFQIIPCYTQSDVPDENIAADSVKQCFEEFGKKKVEAIYVSIQRGVNTKSIPDLVKIANAHKIPTFSQSGSQEVKYGFLMSLAQAAGFRASGNFYAQTMAKIFNGAKPGQVDQVLEAPQKIAINEKTAELIAFQMPIEFIEVVDEVYREIVQPEN